MPQYAIETARWLHREGLVAEGQLTERAKERDLTAIIPPNLKNIVQSMADSLPPGPSAVLRCASVLGTSFSQSLLLAVLPDKVACSMDELEGQLHLLQVMGILSRAPPGHPSFAAGRLGLGSNPGLWVFLHTLHQEVIYGGMAHAHRLEVHRRAAEALRHKAESAQYASLTWKQLLLDQAQHVEQLVLGFQRVGRNGFQQKTDLDALVEVLDTLANNAEAAGRFAEGIGHRVSSMHPPA